MVSYLKYGSFKQNFIDLPCFALFGSKFINFPLHNAFGSEIYPNLPGSHSYTHVVDQQVCKLIWGLRWGISGFGVDSYCQLIGDLWVVV